MTHSESNGPGNVTWLRGQTPSGESGAGAQSGRKPQTVVSFDRHELREIMNVYGRMVAAGEWRDYALDFLPEKAVFSIYRRTSEMPLYRVEKDPSLARKQGVYSVVAPAGLILRRGHDLPRVLAVLEKKIRLVAD